MMSLLQTLFPWLLDTNPHQLCINDNLITGLMYADLPAIFTLNQIGKYGSVKKASCSVEHNMLNLIFQMKKIQSELT